MTIPTLTPAADALREAAFDVAANMYDLSGAQLLALAHEHGLTTHDLASLAVYVAAEYAADNIDEADCRLLVQIETAQLALSSPDDLARWYIETERTFRVAEATANSAETAFEEERLDDCLTDALRDDLARAEAHRFTARFAWDRVHDALLAATGSDAAAQAAIDRAVAALACNPPLLRIA